MCEHEKRDKKFILDADVKVVGSDEGTNHWECEKCGGSCNDIFYGFVKHNRMNEEIKETAMKEIASAIKEWVFAIKRGETGHEQSHTRIKKTIDGLLSQNNKEWREKISKIEEIMPPLPPTEKEASYSNGWNDAVHQLKQNLL